MEILARLETFNREWDNSPKNKVITTTGLGGRGRIIIGFFTKIRSRRIKLTIVIGQRKGISEEITIVDDSKTIQADQLILQENNAFYEDARLVDLKFLRNARKNNEDLIKTCQEHMAGLLFKLQNHKVWKLTILTMKDRLQEGSGHPGNSVNASLANFRN